MHDVKKSKRQTQVFLLRLWSCCLTAHINIRQWIAADTLAKFLNDEKTPNALKRKMFKRPNHVTDQLYEVELVKSEIEHWEPIIAWFLNLKYGKRWNLKLYYIFLQKFYDADKYKKLEMVTDSLHLVLSEGNLADVFPSEKRDEWNAMRLKGCTVDFNANALDNYFLRIKCRSYKKNYKTEPWLFMKEIRCTKCCVHAIKRIVAKTERIISTSSAAAAGTNWL